MKKKIGIIAKYFLKFLTGIVIVSIFFALYGFFQISVLEKSYASYFGYGLFVVETGSMAPTIEKEDMVIVKKTNEIKTNDIITYSLNDNFITHRVVEVEKNKVITKGDSNNFEDKTIPRKTVIGKVVKVVPNFGIWKKIMLSPAVIVVVFFTIILFGLGLSYEDKKKANKTKENNKKKSKTFEFIYPYIEKLEKLIKDYKANKYKPKEENKTEKVIEELKDKKAKDNKNEIKGTVRWEDSENRDGIRPDKVTVKLIKESEVVESKDITKDNNWNYSFDNVDGEYTIDLAMVSGYRKEIREFDIVNTHEPKKMNINGEINWVDNNKNSRPEKITVKLLKNNEVIETKEISEKNNWRYTFINLYKYENGKEIQYSIEEDQVPDYKSNTSGYNITNSYISNKKDTKNSTKK